MTIGFTKDIKESDLFSKSSKILSEGKVGIEKECLRVSNSKISLSRHPDKLGSSLCNQNITTDFSEAQLELITRPFRRKEDANAFLEDIHHFVSNNIDDEILWLVLIIHIKIKQEI